MNCKCCYLSYLAVRSQVEYDYQLNCDLNSICISNDVFRLIWEWVTTSLLLNEIYEYLTVSTGVVSKWRRHKANDWKQKGCPHSLGVWKHLTSLQGLTLFCTSSLISIIVSQCSYATLGFKNGEFYKKIPREYPEPVNA